MAYRIDDIGFGGKRLKQDTEGFCYGVDAVLLADFCQARDGERVLDLCTGNGVVPVIISGLCQPKKLLGVDFQASAIELAKENAKLNELENAQFICADILNKAELPLDGSWDLVTCNPPYFEKGRGIGCDADTRLSARHETTAVLADFMLAAALALKKGGRLAMVHRPSRLPEIMSLAIKNKLEPKRLRLVTPHAGEAPNIVLIECIKGAGKELKVLPELIVRDENEGFTEEVKRVYRRTE